MLMSEQYSLDQLRDLFKIEGRTKRDALKALNAKIRTMKQQGRSWNSRPL